MNREHLCGLTNAAQGGNAEAERCLVDENMALVYAIARRYLGRGCDLDDLVQLGSMGLVKAIRRFDPSYGVCFSTYAVPLIAGEIKRFLRDDAPVKCSRTIKQLSYSLKKLLEENSAMGIEEAAQRLGVEPAEAASAFAYSNCMVSLEAQTGDEGFSLLDRLKVESDEEVTVERITLSALLEKLAPRDKLLVELRYFHDCTQKQAAERLGVSQVQISRLEKRIIMQLRESFHK